MWAINLLWKYSNSFVQSIEMAEQYLFNPFLGGYNIIRSTPKRKSK